MENQYSDDAIMKMYEYERGALDMGYNSSENASERG